MFATDLLFGAAELVRSGPPGTIMPVVNYSAIWSVLGWLLVALIALYFALAYLFTRPREQQSAPVPVAPRPSIEVLRAKYLRQVDETQRLHDTGQLSARRAHARLSVIVRDYVNETTGIQADKMTLTDLRGTRLTHVTHAVSQYYPLVFGVHDATGVQYGADEARRVIYQWH